VSEKLLTADEVAEQLRVSSEWVRECARRADLASVKLGHYRRFTQSDVDAYIESHRTVVNSGERN